MISAVVARCLSPSANYDRSHRWETIKIKATEAVHRVKAVRVKADPVKVVAGKAVDPSPMINRVNPAKVAVRAGNNPRNRNAAGNKVTPARRVDAAASVTTIRIVARARAANRGDKGPDPAVKEGPAVKETRTDKTNLRVGDVARRRREALQRPRASDPPRSGSLAHSYLKIRRCPIALPVPET
jgi:hypothetical protein